MGGRFYAINDRRLIYRPEMLANALQRLIRISGFFVSVVSYRCHTKRRTRNVWSEKWEGLGRNRLNDTKQRETVIYKIKNYNAPISNNVQRAEYIFQTTSLSFLQIEMLRSNNKLNINFRSKYRFLDNAFYL